ncbi:MAG TPA: hypothetical protein EYQ31_03000 [Candidatus Handelsmanbacteria bacterium]|nr:hypothetical protein [Candidatus Handelsmanbacteria bacterium]
MQAAITEIVGFDSVEVIVEVVLVVVVIIVGRVVFDQTIDRPTDGHVSVVSALANVVNGPMYPVDLAVFVDDVDEFVQNISLVFAQGFVLHQTPVTNSLQNGGYPGVLAWHYPVLVFLLVDEVDEVVDRLYLFPVERSVIQVENFVQRTRVVVEIVVGAPGAHARPARPGSWPQVLRRTRITIIKERHDLTLIGGASTTTPMKQLATDRWIHACKGFLPS